jgi:hypothetical protein
MSDPPVTGHTSAVETGSDTFNPVADHQALYGAGRSLMAGVKRLHECPEPPVVALTFLAGQAAECLLKALLVGSGVSEKSLHARNVRHDLVYLWREACKPVSALPGQPPEWLAQLSRLHAAPYVLRYPLGMHGLVLPVQTDMVDGLEGLVGLTKVYLSSRA